MAALASLAGYAVRLSRVRNTLSVPRFFALTASGRTDSGADLIHQSLSDFLRQERRDIATVAGHFLHQR